MSWERRIMAQFEAYVHRDEARAARVKSQRFPQQTDDEKDLRLAEEQRRLEQGKKKLEDELGELERTAIIKRADLQRQVEWYERRLEFVKRQRWENRGFATTLEY